MYMHEKSLKRALGLDAKDVKRMPADLELPPQRIDGVMVYITTPNKGPKGKSQFGHRVMAICPECGKHVSAGRMFQHRKVHGVKSDWRYVND